MMTWTPEYRALYRARAEERSKVEALRERVAEFQKALQWACEQAQKWHEVAVEAGLTGDSGPQPTEEWVRYALHEAGAQLPEFDHDHIADDEDPCLSCKHNDAGHETCSKGEEGCDFNDEWEPIEEAT
jgi:hypothetical protein